MKMSSLICLVPELGQLEQLGAGQASLFLQEPFHVAGWASSQHGRITGVGLPTWLLRLLPAQEFQETGKSFQASHDQGSEVTQCHFSHVLYIKISYRDQNGEDYTKV